MPMYNLIEYSNNYAKKSEGCRNITEIIFLEMII